MIVPRTVPNLSSLAYLTRWRRTRAIDLGIDRTGDRRFESFPPANLATTLTGTKRSHDPDFRLAPDQAPDPLASAW
jgi:hypothetical protein